MHYFTLLSQQSKWIKQGGPHQEVIFHPLPFLSRLQASGNTILEVSHLAPKRQCSAPPTHILDNREHHSRRTSPAVVSSDTERTEPEANEQSQFLLDSYLADPFDYSQLLRPTLPTAVNRSPSCWGSPHRQYFFNYVPYSSSTPTTTPLRSTLLAESAI